MSSFAHNRTLREDRMPCAQRPQDGLFNNHVDSNEGRPQAPSTMHRVQMKQHELYGTAHLWNALIVVHDDEGTAVSSLVASIVR